MTNPAAQSAWTALLRILGLRRRVPEDSPAEAANGPAFDLTDEEFLRWRSEKMNEFCGGPPVITQEQLKPRR